MLILLHSVKDIVAVIHAIGEVVVVLPTDDRRPLTPTDPLLREGDIRFAKFNAPFAGVG